MNTPRRRFGEARVAPWLSSLALCLAPVACSGEDGEADPSGAGGAGVTSATVGAGGAGGEGEPACPPGSHPGASGRCEATLGAWQVGPPLQERRDHHVTFVAETAAGAFLYAGVGAVDQKSAVSSIERAPIAADGSVGAWQTLPVTLQAIGPGVARAGRRVLVAGGIRAGGVTAKTWLTTVADDGALGPFEPGPDMLAPRFHLPLEVHDGWVYAVGGIQADGTSQASVERAPFDATRGVGAWEPATALPGPRSHHALVLAAGSLYAIAGIDRYDGKAFLDKSLADVLRARIEPGGGLGPWEKVAELAAPLAVHSAFAHASAIYVVGGLEGEGHAGVFTGAVRRMAVAEDGSLGPAEPLAAALPLARGHSHQTPMLAGVVYSVAGAAEVAHVMTSQAEVFFARFE
jgi:hypothetical protein